MKVQIYGCRGSTPRPNREMARYGGNTPCVEVISASGERVIFDLGSGAVDLGQKLLGEVFAPKKPQKEEGSREKEDEVVDSNKPQGGGSENKQRQSNKQDESTPAAPSQQNAPPPKPGGSIFLTQTHWDHIHGLPFFVPLYLPQFEWSIYGPRVMAKSLQEVLSGQMQHEYFPVRMRDFGSRIRYVSLGEDLERGVWLGNHHGTGLGDHKLNSSPDSCGGESEEEKKKESASSTINPLTSLRVTTKYLNNTVLTLGYKLEEFMDIPPSDSQNEAAQLPSPPSSKHMKKHKRKKCVSMAYMTDHEQFDHSLANGGLVSNNNFELASNDEPPLTADQSHSKFFSEVDLLIHDCQYLFSEYCSSSNGASLASQSSLSSKENRGHSTVEYVVEAALLANVKHLVLFHHDPKRTDNEMDHLIKYAENKSKELEDKYFEITDEGIKGENSFASGKSVHNVAFKRRKRTRMKVSAAKEGDIYELDPIDGDDTRDDVADLFPGDRDLSENDLGIHLSEEPRNEDSEKDLPETVLLGLYETDGGSITDMLHSTINNLEVKSLQISTDILDYAKKHKPSVVVLDQHLFGKTGLEICEEIRNSMGAWGRNVPILVLASSKPANRINCVSDGRENSDLKLDRNENVKINDFDAKRTAELLKVEDYIQGPYSPAYLLTRIQMSLLRIPLRWRRAPIPPLESLRISTLERTGLLDSEPDEGFDRITRLAKAMFNVPITILSLVDTNRQWFKSICGLNAKETPRDFAFCAHAILEDDLLVVPDALQDKRFADNPLVMGEPNVRFYAGCPIRVHSHSDKESDGNNGTGDKVAIGTFCIIDSKPRDLRQEERRALHDFGAMVEREISLQDTKNLRRQKVSDWKTKREK